MAESFAGVVGRTVAESQPHWPPRPGVPGSAPDVVIVVLDDVGWSDFGCFGSPIRTPHFDSLAAAGLRYTNFHVTPLCSPTRASLLTGLNHHSVGMRFLSDADTGFPNSRGRVSADVPMLPAVLQEHGYGTYLVGKWHLTPHHEVTPAGPHRDWPLARGFDRFYGFLDGCTDQYFPELYEDNRQVPPPDRPGYHLSEDLVDQAATFLANHVAFRPDDPFFLQVAFGAAHAPMQAPRSYIEPYVEVFADGWDVERKRRLRRQVELGVLPEHTRLTERDPNVPPWAELSPERQRLYTHLQATYAGMMEHTDAQFGRLLAVLEELGRRQNTLVLVMSDNGASREGGTHGAVDCNWPYSGLSEPVEAQVQRLELLGGPDGPAHYPEGWAGVGNAPFRKYKQYVDLGGVRSPLIVAPPAGAAGDGEVRTQFVHVVDVMPTVLELVGLGDRCATHGASFRPTFVDPSAPAQRRTQYWEMLGHRALWRDGWKAVTVHEPGSDYDADTWRLYDTVADPSESTDVAERHPELLRELVDCWWEEARRHDVLPLDDRPLVELLGFRSPFGQTARKSLELPARTGHIPFATGLTGSERSFELVACLAGYRADHQGVLFASGSAGRGYVLYVADGRLVFEHHGFGSDVEVRSVSPLPTGDCELGVRLERDPDSRASRATLVVSGADAGSADIETTSAHLSFWGADIGRDPVSQVGNGYQGENPFSAGVLRSVRLTYHDRPPIAEIAAALEHIE